MDVKKIEDGALKKLIKDEVQAYEAAQSLPGFKAKDYQLNQKITPLLKEFIYRWWGRYEIGDVPDTRYKPSRLKKELDTITRGHVSDTHIMTLMYQQRRLYQREKDEQSPLKKLQRLLKNEEGNNIEVKRSLSKMLVEAIAITTTAFANGSGGTIIVGLYELNKIQHNPGDLKINGFGLCGLGASVDEDRIYLTKYLGNNTTLDIQTLSIELEVIQAKKVMLLHVPAQTQATGRKQIVFHKDDAYVREDNHNHKLTPREIYTIALQLA